MRTICVRSTKARSQSSGGKSMPVIHKLGVWHIKTIRLVGFPHAGAFWSILPAGIN